MMVTEFVGLSIDEGGERDIKMTKIGAHGRLSR